MVKAISAVVSLLLCLTGCVHREACVEGTVERDGRCVPAVAADAATFDGGGDGTDSGGVDAGPGVDSGMPDMDGGPTDAGTDDAGTDAGPLVGTVVFATSVTYTGSLGGLAGADTRCQNLAMMAGLSGTFKAWLSDTTGSPSTRISGNRSPYIRTDGTQVATDWTDFRDAVVPGPAAPINLDERGDPVAYDQTWTATNIDGTHRSGATSAFGHCSNWTSTSGNGGYGQVDSMDHRWTENGAFNCNMARGLYCIED